MIIGMLTVYKVHFKYNQLQVQSLKYTLTIKYRMACEFSPYSKDISSERAFLAAYKLAFNTAAAFNIDAFNREPLI